MYASITSLRIKPGQMPEFLRIWNGSIYPLVRSQPGVVGGYVLTNIHANKAMSVILYESEAQVVASQTSGKFRELVAMLAPTVLLETVVREGFVVEIQV